MPQRTIAWPEVTEDNSNPPKPVVVSDYNIYFDGGATPVYTVPAPTLSQLSDFPFNSTTQVQVAAVGPGGEGARSSVVHNEGSGIPAAPGPVTVT